MQEQENSTSNIDNLIGNFNYDDFLIDIEPLEHQHRHNSIDTNDTPVSSCNQESINNDDDICCNIKIINNNNDDVISSSSSSTTSSGGGGGHINMLYNLKLEPTTINYNDLFIQQQPQNQQQQMGIDIIH